MKLLAFALLPLISGCSSYRRPTTCPESESWPVSPTSLVRRVEVDDVPRDASNGEIAKLPGGDEAMAEWMIDQIRDLKASLQPGDEVWFYREEKCDRCGWYREGYVAIRNCTIVYEINTLEDM